MGSVINSIQIMAGNNNFEPNKTIGALHNAITSCFRSPIVFGMISENVMTAKVSRAEKIPISEIGPTVIPSKCLAAKAPTIIEPTILETLFRITMAMIGRSMLSLMVMRVLALERPWSTKEATFDFGIANRAASVPEAIADDTSSKTTAIANSDIYSLGQE